MKDNEQDETWPTKYLIILWYIWKWRNGACFDRTAYIPHHKTHYLLEKCEELIQAIHKDAQESSNGDAGQSEILIRWHSPPAGWTQLNTDGASKGNLRRAGGGGVLRGDKGEWICGFGESMGTCTAMKAEIKAVF